MIKQVVRICLFMLVTLPAHATLLQLDFSVDINQKWEGSSYYDPDILLNYSLTIDTSSPNSNSGTIPDGREYASTFFSPSNIPETQFTSEVLSNIPVTLNPPWVSTGIYREYSIDGYNGSGVPETFEAIFLTLDANSPISQTTNQWTSYQRGLQRQMPIGLGNSVTTFDGDSFQAYMESLIGDSNFYFGDYFIISEYYPETNSGATIYQYGYAGYATLINVSSVSSVPSPSSLLLILAGALALFASLRINREQH